MTVFHHLRPPCYHEVALPTILRCANIDSLLSPERAALCETGLATGRLAQDLRAALADDDGLCVREDGGDCEASRALDIHEEGAGSGDEILELVLAGLTVIELVEGTVGGAKRAGVRTRPGWG